MLNQSPRTHTRDVVLVNQVNSRVRNWVGVDCVLYYYFVGAIGQRVWHTAKKVNCKLVLCTIIAFDYCASTMYRQCDRTKNTNV